MMIWVILSLIPMENDVLRGTRMDRPPKKLKKPLKFQKKNEKEKNSKKKRKNLKIINETGKR